MTGPQPWSGLDAAVESHSHRGEWDECPHRVTTSADEQQQLRAILTRLERVKRYEALTVASDHLHCLRLSLVGDQQGDEIAVTMRPYAQATLVRALSRTPPAQSGCLLRGSA